MKFVIKVFIVVFICYLVTTCGVSNKTNTNRTTKFAEGRNLYVSKCTSCHKAYEPELHTTLEWKTILDEMGRKAKLSTQEKETILRYLSDRN
jgi:hypothetical protein